jgi:hypothetical protein
LPKPPAGWVIGCRKRLSVQINSHHWTPAQIEQEIAPGRRLMHCRFSDEGYTYQDALALARLWGVGAPEAKAKIEGMLTAGQRRQVAQAFAQARRS